MTQKPVGRGDGRESSELHHIFPRAYLRKCGIGDQADLALNFTFLTAGTNVFISDRPPSEYIGELVTRTALNDGIDESAARQVIRSRLESHLIDGPAFEALMSDDYDQFLLARAAVFRRHLSTRFGVQVIEAPA